MNCEHVGMIISAHLDGEAEPTEWRAAQDHLASCTACRQTYVQFAKADKWLAKNVFQLDPDDRLWQGIQQGIASSGNVSQPLSVIPNDQAKPRFSLGWLAVAALVLLCGLWFLRPSTSPHEEQDLALNPIPEVKPDVLPLPVRKPQSIGQYQKRHMERVKIMLLAFSNSDTLQQDWQRYKLRSQELLEEHRILRDLDKEPKNHMMPLWRQTKIALLELANMENVKEVQRVRDRLSQRDLLLKINLYATSLDGPLPYKYFSLGLESRPMNSVEGCYAT